MKLVKYLALAMVVVSALSILPYATALTQPSWSARNVKPGKPIKIVEAVVVSTDNSNLIVMAGEETLELFAKGRWLVITNELIDRALWAGAKNYVVEGDALVAISSAKKEGETLNLVLGLAQGDTVLLRPILLKREAKRYVHTSNYVSVGGRIVDKGKNYLVIERSGFKGLVAIGSESKWVKAGGGEVTWSEASGEFEVGDDVRIFCHNVLIMKEEFAGNFGISAFVWGYSGAIINLTSGTTLSRA